MQTIWGKRCGNPFSWQEKKSATRNTTRLENRGQTNTHPIWGAIKSVKPKVSSRDCCRGLTGTAALEQLLQKHSWPSPKVLSGAQHRWGLLPLPSPAIMFSFCLLFGLMKTCLFSVQALVRANSCLSSKKRFSVCHQILSRHHLRRIDRLW